MRNRNDHPDQIGEYWLSKKPGREAPDDPWCRTWYEKRARQTRHISLGTSNVQEARLILADWVLKNGSVSETASKSVLIESVLLRYWEKHGQSTLSASGVKAALARWQDFWEGRTVSEITPDEQEKFRRYLGEGKLKSSTIDKTLSVGRAALKFAHKRQELDSPPHIFMVESIEERRSREPMGDPITPLEMAKLFQACHHRHHFVFMLLAVATLARPQAILDFRREQYDAAHQRLDLNPVGRKQTKKFRPILPVAPTIRHWLEAETNPDVHIVNYKGAKIASITHAFQVLRERAGLKAGITAYSFRHGMAREFRKRRVPLDEIGLFLGHRTKDSSATTSIYAPMEPEYCTNAVAAIAEVFFEILRHAPDLPFDAPALFAEVSANRPATAGLGYTKTQELHAAILAGIPVKVLAERFGISDTAVYKHRRKLGIRWW